MATNKLPFTPANSQSSASSRARVIVIAWETLGNTPLNTTPFLTVQIVQAPKMITEFNPHLASLPTMSEILCHHSKKSSVSTCDGGTERRKRPTNYECPPLRLKWYLLNQVTTNSVSTPTVLHPNIIWEGSLNRSAFDSPVVHTHK